MQTSNGVKKIVLLIFVFLSIFSLMPSQARADLLPIVQCGGEGQFVCTFCSFFDMITRIIQFIITRIVPLIATLLLVIGGAMFFFAGADPKYVQLGKDIVTSTLVGLVIIFTAFLIVGTVLSAIGLASWTQGIYKNWWSEGFFQIPGC